MALLTPCAFQVVTSTDQVVGRTSVGTASTAAVHVGAVAVGRAEHRSPSSGGRLRAERCRFEGGVEGGVVVQGGTTAELLNCSLGLTARGSACHAVGATAVLQGCRVEGGVAASENISCPHTQI
jgi:hypothetical protein